MQLATDSPAFRRTVQEGAEAFAAGEPPTACPYGPFCDPEACRSIEHYGWQLGWNIARLKAEREAEGVLVIDLGEPAGRLH